MGGLFKFIHMVVIVQNSPSVVAFEVDGASPYTFEFVKREDMTKKTFQSNSYLSTLRVPVFKWQVVSDPDSEDIPNGFIYLSAGQYDYIVSGTEGRIPATGLLRIDVFKRSEPITYEVEPETFKVYGQE